MAQLAFEAPSVSGDGSCVNDLAQQLGRRARKRVRRALEPFVPRTTPPTSDVAGSAELRGLAGAVVLERDQAELRTALSAWLRASDGESAPPLPRPISPRRSARARALALLRRVVAAWPCSCEHRGAALAR